MTAYNRESYIGAAIESVLTQWWTDLELIVVDDGSSDRTVEIARDYARRDPRVRVYANERNLGDYANRNHTASLGRGEFLKFHDSDDIMYAHCLSVMVTAMQAEPTAGFGLSNGAAWPGGRVPMLLTPTQAYQREFLGHGLFMCGPAGALFRANVFRQLGGFQDFGAPSDTIFWMRACARYPVLLLPGDLFYYREHEGQSLRARHAAAQYATVPAHMWRALAALECPLNEQERTIARRNLAFTTARSVWRAARQGDFSLAYRRIEGSQLTVGEWFRYLRSPRRSVYAGTSL
jgi:hypothetical protein